MKPVAPNAAHKRQGTSALPSERMSDPSRGLSRPDESWVLALPPSAARTAGIAAVCALRDDPPRPISQAARLLPASVYRLPNVQLVGIAWLRYRHIPKRRTERYRDLARTPASACAVRTPALASKLPVE